MREGPDIARIASLVGDPARANMLSALMDGGALTASELALEAGVGLPTASSHLSKLIDGRPADASRARAGIATMRWPEQTSRRCSRRSCGVAAGAGPQRARPARATPPCARRGSATIISPATMRWRCSTALLARGMLKERRRRIRLGRSGAAVFRRDRHRYRRPSQASADQPAGPASTGASGARISPARLARRSWTKSSPRNGRGASRKAAPIVFSPKGKIAFAKTFLP